MAENDQPTHSPDGVDLTLIRWMLSLTPEERLAVAQANAQAIMRLCEALIEIKEEVGHEKDRAVLAILRRTLEEKRRR
jgi:hypothetical protein